VRSPHTLHARGLGDDMSLRDVGQFRVEHAGEREQIVTLVL
jgi:hypothetical protein